MQMPQALSARRAALLATALILLVCGVLIRANASGARPRPVAHLAFVRGDPLTVSGRGFRARVRVQLVALARGAFTRRPVANRHGRFTVTFPTSPDRCSGWMVTATQTGRSTVVLRSPAKPMCAPLGTQ